MVSQWNYSYNNTYGSWPYGYASGNYPNYTATSYNVPGYGYPTYAAPAVSQSPVQQTQPTSVQQPQPSQQNEPKKGPQTLWGQYIKIGNTKITMRTLAFVIAGLAIGTLGSIFLGFRQFRTKSLTHTNQVLKDASEAIQSLQGLIKSTQPIVEKVNQSGIVDNLDTLAKGATQAIDRIGNITEHVEKNLIPCVDDSIGALNNTVKSLHGRMDTIQSKVLNHVETGMQGVNKLTQSLTHTVSAIEPKFVQVLDHVSQTTDKTHQLISNVAPKLDKTVKLVQSTVQQVAETTSTTNKTITHLAPQLEQTLGNVNQLTQGLVNTSTALNAEILPTTAKTLKTLNTTADGLEGMVTQLSPQIAQIASGVNQAVTLVNQDLLPKINQVTSGIGQAVENINERKGLLRFVMGKSSKT